jgi:hypothetical protein
MLCKYMQLCYSFVKAASATSKHVREMMLSVCRSTNAGTFLKCEVEFACVMHHLQNSKLRHINILYMRTMFVHRAETMQQKHKKVR